MARKAYIAAWVAWSIAIWVIVASFAILWLADGFGMVPPLRRPYIWLVYAPYFGRSLLESLYLIESATIASAPFIGFFVRYGLFRKPKIYGETRGATTEEMQKRGVSIVKY
jgi:hypothetical protein